MNVCDFGAKIHTHQKCTYSVILGPTMYTPLEALALFLKCDLTEQQYQMLRMGALGQGADIYPPLYKVQEEKKKCVPEGIENPNRGEYLVSMQNCLHHKLSRMLEDEQLLALIEDYGRDPNNEFFFQDKYGSDGFSGNAQYHSDDEIDQSNVYASHLVGVHLRVENKLSGKSNFLWINPNANSWTAITYLRLAFEKETTGICE